MSNFPIHHSRHNIFPIHGTAVVVKINFPIRGFAAHGEIYLHHSCSAIHGENIVPFVIQVKKKEKIGGTLRKMIKN